MGDLAEATDDVTNKNKPMDDGEPRSYASPPCYQHELAPSFHEQPQANDWTSVRHWRRVQRKQLIERRQSLDSGEQSRASTTIIQTLDKEPRFAEDNVGFYWPLRGEIDLRPLMRTFLSRKISVALPVITERNRPLEFRAWDETTRMRLHEVWDIPVPDKSKLLSPSVLFIPLLGFDEQGHRLGHGGGYYDRTLANFECRPFTVGIGYEFSRLPSIYPQDHDVPMDVIVTESGIVWHNR